MGVAHTIQGGFSGAVVAALCGTLPLPISAMSTAEAGRSLRWLDAAPLRYGYRLAVSELPPVLAVRPASSGGGVGAAAAVCPVAVRAVIRGESPADDFAILGTPAGGELVAVGDGVRTGHGWFVVVAIADEQVLLRRGAETVFCALGNPEPPQPGGVTP